VSAPTGPAPMTSAFLGRDAESVMCPEGLRKKPIEAVLSRYTILGCSRHEIQSTPQTLDSSWPGTSSAESNMAGNLLLLT
jgi:hypothetical protein